MYAPNRIGPYPIVDPDRGLFWWPGTWSGNMDNLCGTNNQVRPNFRDAFVLQETDSITWENNAVLTISTDKSFTLAVALEGAVLNNSPMTWSGHASAYAVTDQDVSVEIGFGRLETADINPDVVSVKNDVVQRSTFANGLKCCAEWQGSFLNIDQNSTGYGTNPMVLYGRFVNVSGQAANLSKVHVSLSFHKFVQGIQRFDPGR